MGEESCKTWSKQAADRRDVRATKSEPPTTLHTRRQNRRKWCRGKVGVEHKTICQDYKAVKLSYSGFSENFMKGWKVLVCTECGKELATYFPRRKDKPDWVTG